jgi:hypothetical protein
VREITLGETIEAVGTEVSATEVPEGVEATTGPTVTDDVWVTLSGPKLVPSVMELASSFICREPPTVQVTVKLTVLPDDAVTAVD